MLQVVWWKSSKACPTQWITMSPTFVFPTSKQNSKLFILSSPRPSKFVCLLLGQTRREVINSINLRVYGLLLAQTNSRCDMLEIFWFEGGICLWCNILIKIKTSLKRREKKILIPIYIKDWLDCSILRLC